MAFPTGELTDTEGADGASIITVTDAVADLPASDTIRANTDIVPDDCGTASSANVDPERTAGVTRKAQVELNVGADWEQVHA